MLFRLGLFSPGGKLFLGNLPRLDPGEVPLVFPSVLAEYQILLAVLCPLLHRSDIPAELPGWLRPAAILCRDPSNNRKVSAAVSAPANWDIFCNTVPQRKINQSTDSVRIQNHSTGILTHRSETNRNRFEAKQFRIVRLVKNIVRLEVLLYVSAHLMAAIEVLPPQCRLVMKCSLEGLRIAEIADRLRISEETVKEHKQNGKRKLVKMLDNPFLEAVIFFL